MPTILTPEQEMQAKLSKLRQLYEAIERAGPGLDAASLRQQVRNLRATFPKPKLVVDNGPE